MNIITSIILGVVEGITEFLPISSTGHLILTSYLLKIPQTDFVKSFEVIIQLGAIGSVVVIYWRDLFVKWDLMKRIAIAFLPTAVIGLIFYKFIKTYLLGSMLVVIMALALGGLVLILVELWLKKREEKLIVKESKINLETITYKQAILLGLSQSFAMIPGVSRSAATIVGGLLLGLKREDVVKFSFLLAVPTMLAATGLDLLKSSPNFSSNELGLLLVGFVVSFVVALLAIKTFLDYIRKHDFIIFGWYRIIIAAIFTVLVFS